MFDKPLPFFIRVWYYKTQKRMYVLKMCSKEIGGLIMANAAGTAQKMRRRKENHKFSRMMAVILGLIVTVEVMIAGGMIFNIDFHSADINAVIMGFIVLNNPVHHRVKSCVRYLCCMSVCLQIYSLFFVLC